MSRFRLAILAGVTGCTLAAFGGGADLAKQVAEDVQLRAMTDELARARGELTVQRHRPLSNYPRSAHFIQLAVWREDPISLRGANTNFALDAPSTTNIPCFS